MYIKMILLLPSEDLMSHIRDCALMYCANKKCCKRSTAELWKAADVQTERHQDSTVHFCFLGCSWRQVIFSTVFRFLAASTSFIFFVSCIMEQKTVQEQQI